MAKGLSEQWGVGSPNAAAASTQQRDAFTAAFNGAMQGLTGSLDYTVKKTELTKHQPLAGGRDAVYGKYNQVLGQIDPTDESKAAGAISSLMKAMKALGQKAKEVKQRTEDELAKWNDCAGEREEANDQIDELDAWGIEMIDKLLADRELIDAEEAKRRWKDATDLLRKLRASLAPVYEEYLRQKAAKEVYEPDRQGFDSGFEPLREHPDATDEIKDAAKEIAETLGDVDGKAEEKDYVACNGMLGGLKELLARLKQQVEKQEALKAEYEARLPGVLNRDFEAPESKNGTPGWQLQMDMVNLEENVKFQAEQKNYAKALELLDQLEAKTKEAKEYFAELEAKRQAYEAKKDELLTRATEASADMPAHLGPDYQKIDVIFPKADEAAAMEKVNEAMALLGTMESELAAFEAAMEKHREEKARFEAEWEPLLDRVTESVLATPPELESVVHPINVILDQIRRSSEEEDYATALANFPGLEAAHQELAQLLESHKAYQAKLDEVLPRATGASTDLPEHLMAEYQAVDDLLGQADQAASGLQFEDAINLLHQTETQLAIFEESLAQHQQDEARFEAEWTLLLDRVTQTVLSVPPPLEGDVAEINALLEQIGQASAARNYGLALSFFDSLEAEHQVLSEKLAHYEAQKAEYEERKAEVEEGLERTKADVPKSLQDEKDQVERTKDSADSSGEAGEFEKGEAQLEETHRQAHDLETKATELEAKKKEYEADHKALEGRLAAIGFPADFPMLKEGGDAIVKRKAEAEAAAEAEDYDTALDALSRAAAMAEGYAKELPVYQKQEADYLAKSPPVKKQVQEAGKDVPKDEKAESLYEGMQKGVSIMDGEAEGRDFPAALSTLSQLENGLSILVTFKEKEKQKEEDYNKRAGLLEGPLAEAINTKEKNEDLTALQERLAKQRTTMQEAAGFRDFDQAIEHLSKLEAMVEGYKKLKSDVEAERKTYNDRLTALTQRLAATQPPIPGELASSVLKAIDKNKETMKGFAAQDDFDDALEAMDWVETSLVAYEKLLVEHEKLKAEYENRSGALAGGLAEVAKPVSHMALKMPRNKIFGKQEAMQKAAGQQDYPEALALLDWLEPAVADYLSLQDAMENAKEEYNKRYDSLRPKLDEAADPVDYPEAEEPQGKIVADRAAMEKTADGEDFETALGQIVVLGADVAAYETLLVRLRQQEEDFNSRWTAIKGPLDEALNAKEKNSSLQQVQERMKPRRDKVEEAEKNREFGAGLVALGELEAVFEAYKDHKADVEEERQTYLARYAELQEALEKTKEPLDSEIAAKILASIAKNKATMEAEAEQDNFDEALEAMDWVETSLAAYEDLLRQEKELEERYKKGVDALDAKLSKTGFPVPYPTLFSMGDAIRGRIVDMETQATERDFEAAIDSLNRATAMADGYAKEAEVLKKQEADYRARHAAIKPRLQAIAKAKPSDPKAQAILKSITKYYKTMKDLAAKNEFKEALSLLTQLSGSIATLEAFLAETAVDA